MSMPAHLARIMNLPHVVYCLFDKHDRPLYVGCTYNLERRIGQHTMEQPWWHEVANVRILATVPNRAEGLAEELRLTRLVRPAYNLFMKLPRREWTLDNYLNALSGWLKRRIAAGYGDEDIVRPSPWGTNSLILQLATRYDVQIPGPKVRDALPFVEDMRERRRLDTNESTTREPAEDAA